MSEEDRGKNRTRLLGRIVVIIVVLALNIACVVAVFSLIDSGTATPNIYLGGFRYANNGNISSAYVSVAGTVVNPSSLTAYNVSLFIDLYDTYEVRGGANIVNSSSVTLDTLPGNSARSFDVDVGYSGSYYDDFVNGHYYVDNGLLLSSRFDFGIGFFAIVLPMAVLLAILDVYCAWKLEFFSWIRNRKRVVVTTVAWAMSIALVLIVQFWLFYVANPGISLSNILGWYPGLHVLDWVLIFLSSIVAGAIMADLGTAAYSFLVSLILSTVFEVSYGSFFAWFSMGYGRSFSMIIPGLTFNTYLQSVLQDVFLTFVRMINIAVPCFCVLGAFVGVFLRSYFDPSVDV